MLPPADPHHIMDAFRGPVRLRTLTTLRWMAVIGQFLAIVTVHFGFGFETPIGLCVMAIAASAWLNLFTILRFSPQRVLSGPEAAAYIAFDIAQMSILLAFTGGLHNPFSALIIAPVMIAASILSRRLTALIVLLALGAVTVLALYHMPLPWRADESLDLPHVFIVGVWVALSLSIIFFAAYAHRVAAESAQMRSALAATQLILAREQKLSALGGLAAAAAHELGTPLATIQLTAREMQRDLEDNEELAEDAALLVEQVKRCREILGRLSRRGDEGDAMHERIGVNALLREAADPFFEKADGPEIRIETESGDGSPEPVLQRRPEIVFGLRNFIENAVSFAGLDVRIAARWTVDSLTAVIEDDGPGFSADILARLGEPYLTTRAHGRTGLRQQDQRNGGMGLGFFIAKALLENSGGEVSWGNRDGEAHGAVIAVTWPLPALRAPKSASDAPTIH